ncbi:phosphoglycerate kinase [SAR202 cluster bacterium AC-409-J13_OGT_754m]|nr:phosphoglycerate kinase [SAR202 cluster bacterium AC-409-J13_OGT_754m]
MDILGKALDNPERPLLALLGGAKVSDKLLVLKNLLGKVDTLLIGGGMAANFIKALGLSVGYSKVEDEH